MRRCRSRPGKRLSPDPVPSVEPSEPAGRWDCRRLVDCIFWYTFEYLGNIWLYLGMWLVWYSYIFIMSFGKMCLVGTGVVSLLKFLINST